MVMKVKSSAVAVPAPKTQDLYVLEFVGESGFPWGEYVQDLDMESLEVESRTTNIVDAPRGSKQVMAALGLRINRESANPVILTRFVGGEK